MKRISGDIKYLIGIWTTLLLAVILTYAHHGHILVDCGREAYYPTQILLGKVLYKDIFNIYGPFSYMLNALLFRIFGVNLNVLYIAGCFCAFLITGLIYMISSKFLSKFLSFALAIFTIIVGILNTHLFNFVFPYSYAILYGLTAFLISVWFLLKYQSWPDRSKYLYLSCFFAGICITSKYEFLLYIIAILYAMIKIKKLSFKEKTFSLLSLLIPPAICFGILFWQGLRINDLISTFNILSKMAHSQTLKYFYITQGVYFDKKTIPFLSMTFIKTIIPLGLFLWGISLQKRVFSIILLIISSIAIALFTNGASLVFLPILTLILCLLNLKNLKTNISLTILTISGLAISLKFFWGLIIASYGVFFVSYLMIVMLALISDKFKDKNINYNAIGLYILILSIVLGYQNFSQLKIKNFSIHTQYGKIYTTKILGDSTKELIQYIEKSTNPADEIIILPEGALINFLTNRKTDNYYNSLIPLYVEVFGDKKLIEHFAETKPEYIIFDNWNNQDYYYKYICSDYAISFCNYVAKNYTQEKIIDKYFRYIIFKKK